MPHTWANLDSGMLWVRHNAFRHAYLFYTTKWTKMSFCNLQSDMHLGCEEREDAYCIFSPIPDAFSSFFHWHTGHTEARLPPPLSMAGGQLNSTAFISTAHSKVAQLVELGLEEVKRGGLNAISSCSLLLHRLLVPHAILLPVPAKRQRRQHVMNHLSLLYRGLHLPRLPPSHHHGFVTDFIVGRSDEKSLWGGVARTPCD
jgi:hypothetical protein